MAYEDKKPAQAITNPNKNMFDIPGLSGKSVSITIPETENEKHAVPGCINGIAYNIPRGRSIDVPVEVLGVLNDASLPTLARDGTEIGRTNRFNVQVHG